jgi:hypothetical protein
MKLISVNTFFSIFNVRLSACFLACFNIYIAFSQEQDVRVWAGTEIISMITPDLRLEFNQEVRFAENASLIDKSVTEIGLKYDIAKNIRLGATYRLTNKRRLDNSYRQWHRYNIDFSFRQSISDFRFTFRTRYQSQYKDILSSETGDIPDMYWRNKLSLQYRYFGKFRPYVSSEMFVPLHFADNISIDEIRYSIGSQYRFNRKYTLDLFYLYQYDMSRNCLQKNHIFGAGVNVLL